jgi:two-component system CheB/CheR fusion protein
LRLWSAGCATGEESFSLAILVADLLGDELDRFNVRIFATDLDNDAIAFARRSIYPASSVVGLSPEYVARYFHRIDGDYEVQKRIRNLVVFGQHDLGQRAPFPRIDLVLCRNVLIYFSMELQKRVLQLFAYSLRDQGYLILGKAETTSPLAEFFNPVQASLKIYRRQGERFPIPLSQFKDTTPLRPSTVNSSLLGLGGSVPLLLPREVSQARTAMEKLGNLVFNLPIGVVVVDRRYDIQIINSLAHQLLEIHRSAIGEDLLHLAEQLPTKALRSIIDMALRGEMSPPSTTILPLETESDNQRYLQIVGYPHQLEGDEGPIAGVLLLISDVSEQMRQRREVQVEPEGTSQLEATETPSDSNAERLRLTEENSRFATQVQRLMTANRELRDANRDLTSTNVDLHQANEEYLVNTEEIQAAAEEVETLNEELQATNEELETLNEELQATVEELNATNEDLEARSSELRELVQDREQQRKVSDAERGKLEAVLLGMNDGVLVVDTAGQPILTNSAYHEMFGDGTATLPLVDERGIPIPGDSLPRNRVARGEVFSVIFALAGPRQVPMEDTRWYEANGQPTMINGSAQGGVVVIRDITDRSLRRLQSEFVSMATHELSTPLAAAQAALQQALQGVREQSSSSRASVTQVDRQDIPLQPEPEIDIALRQIRHMTTLVNDLADVRRLQTGKADLHFQPVNLVDVVNRAVQAVQTIATDHQIEVAAPGHMPLMSGDAIRLEQILFNLLMNAVIYAPNSPRIDVRLRGDKKAVEVQVQDYGPGIPSDKFAHLFTAYYQVEQSSDHGTGLGLGLYTAGELVKAHNGTISVSSHIGVGTTFTVTLPRETPGT